MPIPSQHLAEQRAHPQFSERERQILRLARQGLTDAAIASQLGISEATVSTYWTRIRGKVGPKSRTEIVVAMVEEERGSELDSILAKAGQGVAHVSLDGTFLTANPRWCELFGVSQQDVKGLSIERFEAATRLSSSLQEFIAHAGTGVDEDLEVSLPRDGQTFVRLTARIARHETGVAKHLVVTAEDITHYRKTALELDREKSFTQAVLQTIGSLVIVLDATGRIVSFNKACERLTGYTEKEVTGKVFFDLLVPQDEIDPVKEVFEDLREKAIPNRFENHWVAKDGRVRLLAWSNTVLCDPNGEIEYVIGTGIDVTDVRRAEKVQKMKLDVAAKLALSSSVDDASTQVLAYLCAAAGWDLAELWQVDAEVQKLKLVAFWPLDEFQSFTEKGQASFFSRGEGIPGKLWTLNEASLVSNLLPAIAKSRMATARKYGFHTGFGLPVRSGTEVQGVIVGYSKGEIADIPLCESFVEVCGQLGPFLERMAAQSQKSRMEANYQAIFDKALSGILLVTSDGRYLDMNPALCRIVGRSREELLQMKSDSLIPAGWEGYREEARKAIDKDGYWEGEFPLTKPNGELVHLRWHVSNHSLPGVRIAVTDDVTDRVRARIETEQALARLKCVLDTAADAIVSIDEHGIIESANAAVEKLFGYRPEDLLGRNVEILMPEPFKSQHNRYLTTYLATGVNKIIGIGREVRALKRDGTTFSIDLRVSEAKLVDKQVFVGVMRDLSERKAAEESLSERAEALRQAMDQLNSVTYHMSHEMRPPLRSILSAHRTILENISDVSLVTSREDLEKIVGATNLLSKLVDDLLEYVRLGQVNPARGEVNLSEIAEKVAASTRLRKHEAATFHIEPGIRAQGDARLLECVLTELFENACFHGANGPIEVRFEQKTMADDTVYCVSDNGKGFDMRYHDRLFLPFEQLVRQSGRTGMGLAKASRIIEMHGGRVWAESVQGSGARFCFTLGDDSESPSR